MLDLFARALLTVVFLAAVVGKARGFAEFRDSIVALVPRWLPVGTVAGAVVGGEAATVVGLAAAPVAGYVLAVGLLGAFCAGIALSVHKGQSVRCRCFGADGGTLGPRHLVRNGLLIAIAVAGAVSVSTTPSTPAAFVALVTGALLGLLTTRWEDVAFLLVPAGRKR